MESRANVTENIVHYFKENISSENWKVGEKIPSENQLTEILNVSRASVRTAIQHLVGIGVLETKHGKGTYLIDSNLNEHNTSDYKITSKDCLDILKVLEFRKIVESEACFLATSNKSPELLEKLQKSIEIMKNNYDKQYTYVKADIQFHKDICVASQNPILAKCMKKVFEETVKNHNQMYSLFGFESGIYFHNLILEAITNGEAEKSRQLMAEHLQSAIEKIDKENIVGD